MKAHTSSFKENIKLFGRELDSKITYELDGETIELGSEELNSITPHYEGAILKSVMKQLDVDSNVEIPLGTILRYQFGVKVGNEYEYINYGNYVVYNVEKQEDTYSYKITCYDKMLYAMKDYENSNITFPITIKDYLEAICEKVGLEYEGSQFANSDKVIDNELYLDNEGHSLEYTFRDVLDEIAQVSGGTICINNDDKLEVRYIKDVGELTDASGTNLTLETDAEVKLDNFELEGKTTQATRSGKNLLRNDLTSRTTNGLTVVVNDDKSVHIKGTATATTIFNILPEGATNYNLPAGTYILSGCPKNGNPGTYKLDINVGTYYQDVGNGVTFTLASETKIVYSRILVYNGQNVNFTFYPMIRLSNISDATYEPYGVMPSPDYPSELVSVGYQNLLKPNFESTSGGGITISITDKGWLANGTPTSNASFYIFNGTLPKGTYTINGIAGSANNTYQLVVYKAGTIVKYLTTDNYTFTLTEETAMALRLYFYTNYGRFDNMLFPYQLEESMSTHSYIPYGKYGIEIETKNSNLIGLDTKQYRVDLKNGDKLYLHNEGSRPLQLYLYTNYGDATRNDYWSITSNSTKIITVAKDAKAISWNIEPNGNAWVNKGTTILNYEPYIGHTNLIVLDNPLRSIGNTKDLLYIKNGMLYVERRIDKAVLNGSENITLQNTQNNIIGVRLPTNYQVKANTTVFCNYFQNVPFSTYYNNRNYGVIASHNDRVLTNVFASSPNSDITTVEQFKTWLSTHNTEVQYELAEPYTEELGQVDMPSTYEGITYIETTDSNEPTMNITYISEFEEIDEEYLKDVNVNFGEKFGAINTIVLSRGGNGDKISLSKPTNLADEDKIAIQITDNQIMNGNNRADFMQPILSQLYGLEYYINDFSSTGICYLDLCDRYQIKIGNNSYKCIMFNDEVDITQGLEEIIYTDMQEENETEYKYVRSDDRGITQANILAKKNEASITAFTQQLDSTNNRLNSVETKQTATDATINVMSTHIDTNGNITEVTTTTGFTFNADGMTISDSSTNFSALHRNNGTYYYDGNTITGQYTKDGSKQKDLELFGVYYYGMDDINDTPMFVAQLYTDENGEECVGHFYNRGD